MLSILWQLAVGGEGEEKVVVIWAITAMVNSIICKNNLNTIDLKSSQLKNKSVEIELASCHHWNYSCIVVSQLLI